MVKVSPRSHLAARVRQATLFSLALCVVYGLAWLCIEIPERSGRVAPIWLANGFLLALALKAAPRDWPALLVAGLAGNFLAYPGFERSLVAATHYAVSDVAEVVVALLLIRWAVGDRLDFSQRRHLISFVLVCGLIAPGLGTVLAGVHLAGEPFDRPAGQMARWMVANAMGLLVVTPLLLALSDLREDLADRRPDPGALLSLVILGLVLLAVLSSSATPALFLVAPAVMWAVFKLERVGAAVGGAMVGSATIAATLWGRGPIAAQGAGTEAMLLLHGFLASLMLTSLVAAAALREKRVLREQLESASRAAALAQEEALSQESKARQAAEAAADLKANFLADMTHELRTPLTSMIGFARIAQDEAPPTLAGKMERIVTAGEALLQTVNDLLDFSKLEAGQLTIRPRPTALHALGREALELLEPQARAKNIQLEYEASEDCRLMIDGLRVRQVLVNYLSNAVKFTDVGTVRLRTNYDADRCVLRIEVVDTGPGIPPGQVPLVFDRYAQTETGVDRRGTGLGLAICRQLAEAMAGAVGVESVLGEGSAFWLEIPAQASAPEDHVSDHEVSPILGGKVLVVDDNRANRQIARHFLEALGLEVAEAADGREAVEQTRTLAFDAVLMDLQMPGMSGREAAAAIREEGGRNRSVPIIAFSAGIESEGEVLGVGGFDGLVRKPVEPRDLLQALALAVHRAPQQEGVGEAAVHREAHPPGQRAAS